jgi:hypothetical protein
MISPGDFQFFDLPYPLNLFTSLAEPILAALLKPLRCGLKPEWKRAAQMTAARREKFSLKPAAKLLAMLIGSG